MPCQYIPHRRHRVTVRAIADPTGRLIWASPALPGTIHDLSAARTHTITAALASANVMTFADRGYYGAQADGGLTDSNVYCAVISEILQKRCGFGSLGTVFPGITATTYGVTTALVITF